jgi:hypothetical protein
VVFNTQPVLHNSPPGRTRGGKILNETQIVDHRGSTRWLYDDLAAAVVVGDVQHDAAEGQDLEYRVAASDSGPWRARRRVLAAVDGHRVGYRVQLNLERVRAVKPQIGQ